MSEEQKTEWIYAQARVVDEQERQKFLDSLSDKKMVHTELTPDGIWNWCRQVEEGKIYFGTETYEYYEEGAWGSDWKVEYQDICGAIPYLEKAINTCYGLLMSKEYGITYKLLNRICRLEFCTDYDEDYDAFEEEGVTIEDLDEEGLISIDFKKLSLCLLYACYQTNHGQDRIDKLYEHLMWDQCKEVMITDLFAYGPEKIQDEEAFMKDWCVYLMGIFGDRAAKLLVDACIYLGGDDYLLEIARKNIEIHPYLYKQCCERKYQSGDYLSCITIAEEAAENMDPDKVIRADICDIAVKAGKKMGQESRIEHFYEKAFYSDPNSWHLLRLYKLDDKEAIARALDRVGQIKAAPFYGNRGSVEQRTAEICDSSQKILYRFLLGDYSEILKKCREDNKYLGWSFDIKGTVIPLLLLYLKKDEKKKTKAERSLIEEIKYKIQFKSTEDETFDEYLSLWRRSMDMSEKEKQDCIEWLSQEIDKRTEYVVGGGHRHSYYKAAELIVVIGAIREERGEVNGMHRLVEYYKSQHSRKRAFRSEIDELAKKY